MRLKLTLGALLLIAAGAEAALQGEKASAQKTPTDAEVIATQLPSYPLTACPISGEALEEAVDHVHAGRLVRFCCKGCLKPFQSEPAATLAKIDEAVIAEQKPSYPMETCAVCDEKLGEAPIDHVHGTRLVRFCCADCKAPFVKDPKPYMAKVDAALIAAQIPSYPLDTCIVSAEGLTDMGEPYDLLYGTRLVRFCCKSCVKMFKKKPAEFVAQLDESAMQEKPAQKEAGQAR